MKESLKKAILFFNLFEGSIIFWNILRLKMKRRISAQASSLFREYYTYVRLIEKGVILKKENRKMIKATSFINPEKPIIAMIRKRSSDLNVFESVIVNEEYKIAVKKLSEDFTSTQKTIIDAGGNIGLTTLYIHSFYPDSKFFIIEPDEGNCEVLEMNLRLNDVHSAVVLRNALWTSNESLYLDNSFRDGREWSLAVKKKENYTGTLLSERTVNGIRLEQVIESFNIRHVRLLKIDIEGAERFLFNNNGFLSILKESIDNVVIEIHDEFKIRDTIYQNMRDLGFNFINSGSVTMFHKCSLSN